MNQYQSKLIKLIEKKSYHHDRWRLFSDFVEMSAISLSNAVDMIHRKEREAKDEEEEDVKCSRRPGEAGTDVCGN